MCQDLAQCRYKRDISWHVWTYELTHQNLDESARVEFLFVGFHSPFFSSFPHRYDFCLPVALHDLHGPLDHFRRVTVAVLVPSVLAGVFSLTWPSSALQPAVGSTSIPHPWLVCSRLQLYCGHESLTTSALVLSGPVLLILSHFHMTRLFFWVSNIYVYSLFPGNSDGKESACNVGDPGLLPGWGRSLGEGNGYLLQYSCLENSMDREACWATGYGVAKSWTRLSF